MADDPIEPDEVLPPVPDSPAELDVTDDDPSQPSEEDLLYGDPTFIIPKLPDESYPDYQRLIIAAGLKPSERTSARIAEIAGCHPVTVRNARRYNHWRRRLVELDAWRQTARERVIHEALSDAAKDHAEVIREATAKLKERITKLDPADIHPNTLPNLIGVLDRAIADFAPDAHHAQDEELPVPETEERTVKIALAMADDPDLLAAVNARIDG